MASMATFDPVAAVHHYEVLYTPDKERKQKRFYDGLLRYHTFNCKAILADDRDIKVEEHFIRTALTTTISAGKTTQSPKSKLSQMTFENGTEFEFENHLVQIERLVRVEQRDITSIFKKGTPLRDTPVKVRGQSPRSVSTPTPWQARSVLQSRSTQPYQRVMSPLTSNVSRSTKDPAQSVNGSSPARLALGSAVRGIVDEAARKNGLDADHRTTQTLRRVIATPEHCDSRKDPADGLVSDEADPAEGEDEGFWDEVVASIP